MAFEKGKSGNPAGRRKGSPNKATAAVRARIGADVDPVGFLASVMAGEPVKAKDETGGERVMYPTLADMLTASRILVGKLVPDAKDSPVTIALPEIATADDAAKAMGALLKAAAAGEITPSEAQAFVALIRPYVETLSAADFERRLEEIEKRIGRK